MKSPVWLERQFEELREHVRDPSLRAALDALVAACRERTEWLLDPGSLGNQLRLQFLQSGTRQLQCWLRLTQRKLVLCIPDETLARIPGAPHSLQIASGDCCLNAAGVSELTVNGPVAAQLLAALVFNTAGHAADQAREQALRLQRDLPELTRQQLLDARHGQGAFRDRVEGVEARCRVCGVLDRRQLCAVHIKPWRACDASEMLDGHNGLLLSPHVAHLFERGHIAFADDGTLLLSRHLNPAVLDAWSIRRTLQVGAFLPAQCVYLDYHRQWVFEHGQGGRRAAGNQPAG